MEASVSLIENVTSALQIDLNDRMLSNAAQLSSRWAGALLFYTKCPSPRKLFEIVSTWKSHHGISPLLPTTWVGHCHFICFCIAENMVFRSLQQHGKRCEWHILFAATVNQHMTYIVVSEHTSLLLHSCLSKAVLLYNLKYYYGYYLKLLKSSQKLNK